VPYSCEVTIDAFTEKSPTLSVIEAGIVVARRSQKAILIGKDGAKVKELGILARRKLEQVRLKEFPSYIPPVCGISAGELSPIQML
jgi:GTPase Era involved in 16S rRNA processing